ncbi:MAG: aldehyde dehydrogenase [Deltaproteobacteria bacterium RBG_13_47_9]|nr:MAG: aldehyde dehydrogenase [Deltaproteobacteria bacterium RBG_13_47_9]
MVEKIPNFIDGKWVEPLTGGWFEKKSPHSGERICNVARSKGPDAEQAISAAKNAQRKWAETTSVARGDMVRKIALRMQNRRQEIAEWVALETGKSISSALGETDAAIEMGFFIAGEGRRNYGKTMGATMAHRTVLTVRQPLGIAALIIASNTPIANIAWKAFPSIFCGNASILKPSEDTPLSAWIFGVICEEIGLPPGIFNILQGYGREAGMPLVESEDVHLVSFTGSCETGKLIQKVAGERLAKVCLELGGKNPLVVCDDADLERACEWVLSSSFSNAGQRCAASSRIIIFDSIYEDFRNLLVERTRSLRVGPKDDDFLGPVINERQLEKMVEAIDQARNQGARILTGGHRLLDESHPGYYLAPTLIEKAGIDWSISRKELFGPITCLYRARDFNEALDLANDCDYGLTACIHTRNLHRAMRFAEKVESGVVVVNGGTHGSEPHMGFGGVKNSGTGWREAGVEALDVYSDWKYINLITDPSKT